MTRPLGQIHEKRDDNRALIKLLNELRRYIYRGPGIAIAPADEQLAAFRCVTWSSDTGNVIGAASSGTVFASGVLLNAVNIGELTIVATGGVVEGVATGRSANDVVWVGTAGELVFAAPAGYVQTIGVMVNATDMFVSVGAPTI